MKLIPPSPNKPRYVDCCYRCEQEIMTNQPYARSSRDRAGGRVYHAWCATDAEGNTLYPEYPKPTEPVLCTTPFFVTKATTK